MPTVIDTVDIAYSKEYIDNLSKEINPEDIKYIVINHVEPDHAGALPALAAKAKNAKIVTTKLGSDILKEMFKLHNRSFIEIKNGDTLDIGGKTLQFFETPYLHTEETMITYGIEDKTLFPCDLFSTHIANYELFNDLAKSEYIEDFKIYYKLIMSPHRPYVQDMLKKIESLEINMIAPSHGYIIRKDTKHFIQMYAEMSEINPSNNNKKVVIVFSSMTGNTGKIANMLSEGLESVGVKTSILNLKNSNIEQVKEEISESDGVLFGSSTRYGDMVGNIEDLLKTLDSQNTKNKFAAAFGSYGWSGEAIIHIEDYLQKAGFNIINQRFIVGNTGMDLDLFPLRVKFINDEMLEKSKEAGKFFGEQILSRSLAMVH
jgi:flavorubredoxin